MIWELSNGDRLRADVHVNLSLVITRTIRYMLLILHKFLLLWYGISVFSVIFKAFLSRYLLHEFRSFDWFVLWWAFMADTDVVSLVIFLIF